jgi:hypothetical protein
MPFLFFEDKTMSQKSYPHTAKEVNRGLPLLLGISSFSLFWYLVIAFFIAISASETQLFAVLAVMGMMVVVITFLVGRKALEKPSPSKFGWEINFLAGHAIPGAIALGNDVFLLLFFGYAVVIVVCAAYTTWRLCRAVDKDKKPA